MKARVFAALLAVLFAGPAAAEDCHLTIVTSLTSSLDAAGGITVPATIDGHDVKLLVDTAGVFSLLTESTADAIHISRRALNQKFHFEVGGDNHLMSTGAISQTFELGNLEAGRVQFAVIPNPTVAHGADGTLGPSLMANYDLEIDPAHNKFNLIAPDHCPGQAVYWTRTPYASVPMRLDSDLHIIIPVSLDGHAFEAVVDTGSSTSWLIYGMVDGPFGWNESTPGFTPTKEGGNWYRYPFKTLSLNGVDIRNPHILVRKDIPGHGNMPPLIIGMDVLSKLHTMISYSDHTLYFTGANAPPPDALATANP